MAEDALRKSSRLEIRTLAQQIIDAQRKETNRAELAPGMVRGSSVTIETGRHPVSIVEWVHAGQKIIASR